MSWRECNLELLKQINIGRVHHPPMSNNPVQWNTLPNEKI